MVRRCGRTARQKRSHQLSLGPIHDVVLRQKPDMRPGKNKEGGRFDVGDGCADRILAVAEQEKVVMIEK